MAPATQSSCLTIIRKIHDPAISDMRWRVPKSATKIRCKSVRKSEYLHNNNLEILFDRPNFVINGFRSLQISR